MRSLIPLSILLGVCTAEDAPTLLFSNQVIKGHTLEEVYGPVEAVKEMTPQHQRSRTKEGYSKEYFGHRTEEICDFPIELVIVQDATNSFSDDILNMRRVQLQLMIDGLSSTHPGSAFSLISFRDKPLWPLGEVGDYCVQFGSPLSPNATQIVGDYDELAISGGGDPPEAQFISLIAASQSSTPGWGVVPLATRLMVVATDAAPHFEGDGFNVFNLPAFSGSFDEGNAEQQCIAEYYPGPEQVRSALLRREAYLASLVYDGSYDSHLPIESWKWFNAYLGQTEGFVHDIESDSSNFWDRLSQIISEIEDIECGPSSTLPPTTAPASTTPLATTTPESSTVVTTPPPTVPLTTLIPTTRPTTAQTIPPQTPTIAPTTTQETVTPIGTVASTIPETAECPPCPPCEHPDICDPCCVQGVEIKLAYQPAKLHLDVEK